MILKEKEGGGRGDGVARVGEGRGREGVGVCGKEAERKEGEERMEGSKGRVGVGRETR